jgi:hypothetical protein
LLIQAVVLDDGEFPAEGSGFLHCDTQHVGSLRLAVAEEENGEAKRRNSADWLVTHRNLDF